VSVEALAGRLVALRAEIDEILAKLARLEPASSASEEPAQAKSLAEALAAVSVADVPSEEWAFHGGEREPQLAAVQNVVASESVTAERPAASETPAGEDAKPLPAIDAGATADRGGEPPVAIDDAASAAELPQPEIVPAAEVERPADDLTSIAGIDAALADRLMGLGVRSYADIAAWSSGEVARVSAALELGRRVAKENWIEQAAILATGKTTTFAGQRAEAAPAAAVGMPAPIETGEPALATQDVQAAAGHDAGTNVLDIHARLRKQKGGVTGATLMPVRRRAGRRIATRIAASILGLLAAATLLMVADRVAQGSVPPPAWLPLPTYAPTGGKWPFLGERQVGGGTLPTTGRGLLVPALPGAAGDGSLLRRYLQVWPSGS
jgi:predicted flap endonuclease-1-like 5' DNA nuclease